MVGWAAGLSYDTRIQKQYHMTPKVPGGGKKVMLGSKLEDR